MKDTFEIEFHEYIGMMDNFMTKGWCDKVIQYFDAMHETGFSTDRKVFQNTESTLKKDDSLCVFEDEVSFTDTKAIHHDFLKRFWKYGYSSYSHEYDILDTLDSHTIHSQKIQKTDPGGGYHVWHCENGDVGTSRRILSYILYLNDVQEGGETEFLYQKKRVYPKAGTLVIFPAAWTHPHRGNPPLSGSKYIITGWVEYKG